MTDTAPDMPPPPPPPPPPEPPRNPNLALEEGLMRQRARLRKMWGARG